MSSPVPPLLCHYLCQSRSGTRATITVHHFFSEVPHICSLKHVPPHKKMIYGEIKPLPDEYKSYGLGIQRVYHAKKVTYSEPTRYWAKEPRHPETVSDEKYLLPLP